MHLGQSEGSSVVQSLDKLWTMFVDRVPREFDSQAQKFHQNKSIETSDTLMLKFVDELERVRKHLLLTEAGLDPKKSRSPHESRSSRKSDPNRARDPREFTSGHLGELDTEYRLRFSSPRTPNIKDERVITPKRQRLDSLDFKTHSIARTSEDVRWLMSNSEPKQNSLIRQDHRQGATCVATIIDYMRKLASNVSKLAAVAVSCDQVYTRWRQEIAASHQQSHSSHSSVLGRAATPSTTTGFAGLFVEFDLLAQAAAALGAAAGPRAVGADDAGAGRLAGLAVGRPSDGSGETRSPQNKAIWASSGLTLLRVSLDKCRSLGSEMLKDSLTRLEVSSYLVSELRAFLGAAKRISERVIEELEALSLLVPQNAEITVPRQARSMTPTKTSGNRPKKKLQQSAKLGHQCSISTQTVSEVPPKTNLTVSELPALHVLGKIREEATKVIESKIKLAVQDSVIQWKTAETKLAQLDSRVAFLSDSVLTSSTISNLLVRARDDAQNLRGAVFILEQE